MVEGDPKSRSRVQDKAPHLAVMDGFDGASYADQYEVLCRRLIQEILYTSASVIMSLRSAVDDGDYAEMSDITGLRAFVAGLASYAATESAKRLKRKSTIDSSCNLCYFLVICTNGNVI